jgi:hypothetical protein
MIAGKRRTRFVARTAPEVEHGVVLSGDFCPVQVLSFDRDQDEGVGVPAT